MVHFEKVNSNSFSEIMKCGYALNANKERVPEPRGSQSHVLNWLESGGKQTSVAELEKCRTSDKTFR